MDNDSGTSSSRFEQPFFGRRNVLFRFLDALRNAGVHHIILNFKYGKRAADEVMDEIGEEVLPQLAATEPETVAA